MVLFLMWGMAGVTLAVLGISPLRQSAVWRMRVPLWAALLIMGGLLSVGLVIAFMASSGGRRAREGGPAPPSGPGVGPSPGGAVSPLAVGMKAPPLRAQDWLNGPPLAPGAKGAKAVVVDIWALW
jgi:hypothetical protein